MDVPVPVRRQYVQKLAVDKICFFFGANCDLTYITFEFLDRKCYDGTTVKYSINFHCELSKLKTFFAIYTVREDILCMPKVKLYQEHISRESSRMS